MLDGRQKDTFIHKILVISQQTSKESSGKPTRPPSHDKVALINANNDMNAMYEATTAAAVLAAMAAPLYVASNKFTSSL
jgi:hypothetical protein